MQLIRRPTQRLVEMTEIAGIGTAVLDAFANVRRRNLVAAHGVEQAESGVRHVAVVATAAGRTGFVMGVTRQARLHLLVTLQAGLVGFHLRPELIGRRPGLERGPRRGRGRVHLVAAEAGKLSALEAG